MFKVAWHHQYCHPLPQNHRFPMEKYNLLPQQLLHEGSIEESQLINPGLMADDIILLCHDTNYLHQLNHLQLTAAEIRRTGFPLSHELVTREKIIMQGTLEVALHALQDGIGFNIAGGTHHAFSHKGEGFCLLNDMAIAAQYLIHHQKAQQIVIVDLDVHQGNGTAQIFKDEPKVFTMSMHGKKNYPLHKEQSDLDIELDDFTDDETYLRLLNQHLHETIEIVQPDFIFYQAGVDILAEDKLGRLQITTNACMLRDKMVLTACKQRNIPVAVTMGGGYAPDINIIVNAHANTFRLAHDLYY